MNTGELEIMRCRACQRISLSSQLLKRGGCKCGARMVSPTLPVTIPEMLKVEYWWFKEVVCPQVIDWLILKMKTLLRRT